jgi:hypothetical protein
MRVVQYSFTPVAGSPWFTHRALTEWTTVDARFVCYTNRYSDGREYPYDLRLKGHLHEYDELFEQADIIHIQNKAPEVPRIRRLIAGKPMLLQSHQHPQTIRPGMVESDNVIQAIIAQPEWANRCPEEVRLLPNIVPIRDDLFRPEWLPSGVPEPHGRMHVAYAPSSTINKGMHNKGYTETLEILNRLSSEGVLTFDIIRHRPLLETLERKQKAHVVIDECVTGNFHRSSLESLAQGACVLAYLPESTRAFIRNYAGCADHEIPWCSTDLEHLESNLRLLAAEPERVVTHRVMARAFMESYWNDRELVKQYVSIYQELLA